MRTRGLVQIAREAAVAAGNAGRERGPSQTLPAFAVVHGEQEVSVLLCATWGWAHVADRCRRLGLDSRVTGCRMIVRRIPTGGPWFESYGLERRFRPAKVSGRKDGTTANERPRTMASADAAKRLGPLIRNQPTTMGRDNFPKQCGCPSHLLFPDLPDDHATHNHEPCTLDPGRFPEGVLRALCSIHGLLAVYEL